MSNVVPETNARVTASQNVLHEQYPVDAYVGKVSFESKTAGDFIRIVVMNIHNVNTLSPFNEYHFNDTAISIEDVGSFVMRYARLDNTQQAIHDFVAAMPQQFSTPQAANFRCGVYSPTDARRRLYKAPDPDDATHMIGVLLEQDARGDLSHITWYKTRDARSLFCAPPSALEFELVRNAEGEPSTDPNDIGGWTWYFTTSVRACA